MICLRTLILRIGLNQLAWRFDLVLDLTIWILLYLEALSDHHVHAHVLLHLFNLLIL